MEFSLSPEQQALVDTASVCVLLFRRGIAGETIVPCHRMLGE